MSEVLKGRLVLLATVSVMALAALSWGSMASAQDVAEEPASGGETSLEEGGFEGEVTIGEVFDGEVIDGEVPVDDQGGYVEEDDGALVDPAETFPDDGTVVDPGTVEEGEIVDDGTVFDFDVMMQSGVPEMQADTGAAAPVAGQNAVQRETQAAGDRGGNCSGNLKTKDCVAN